MKRIFIVSLIILLVLKVYGCSSNNIEWGIEYKKFQINDKYINNTDYIFMGSGLYSKSATYYITLEDEFGFGTNVSVSRNYYNSVNEGVWNNCTLLNDGGNLSALIPYRIELMDYTQDELLNLFYSFPKVAW